jgi:hypothetical protein
MNIIIAPIIMGIKGVKYVPKLTLPESPSTSGLFNANKKKKKRTPEIINNVPVIPKTTLQNFMVYFFITATVLLHSTEVFEDFKLDWMFDRSQK